MDNVDRLDPVLVDRFRALDEVIPPDTWPGGTALRTSRARWWLVLAAAAAVVLTVSVAVVMRGDDEGAIVGAPVPSASTVPATVAPNATPTPASTVYVVEDARAIAEPAIVRPGDQVTIMPRAAVERICTNIVDVLVSIDGTQIGQITGGRSWAPLTPGGPPPTIPACQGEFTDSSLTVTVPPVADARYRFCIGSAQDPNGCAIVVVASSAPAETIESQGRATPSSAVPGQLVSIAPSSPVRRTCTDLVGVYSGAAYVGHVGGARFSPSPGEGDTVPACEGDVSGEPIAVFVPSVVAGSYLFCVSDDLLAEGCAAVEVLPSPLLATASSTEVATGDAITVTPAGVIDRICTGWVRVFDATLTIPVREVIDPATGASEEPAFGGWEAPDCEAVASDAAVTMVVPDLLLGAYAFCLSAEPVGESCALVSVTSQRFVEPTVPRGATVPPANTAPVTPAAGPIVVGEAGLLGLRFGPTFADADELIRANTVEITDAARPGWACGLGFERVWLTRLGGLTIVWDGDELEAAFGPNWRYDGGAVVGAEGMVSDRGITVGSTRADVLAAYPESEDRPDEMFVSGFRIGFEGDTVVWLGRVECGD